MTRADDMLEQVLSSETESHSAGLANDLLNEFFRGYPLERLRLLLTSANVHALRTGVWIASELGTKCKPLLHDVAVLLAHELPQARFFALDTVLTCAGPQDGDVIAAALTTLQDPEGLVRWKSMDFCIRATTEQLVSGAASLDKRGNDALARSIRWIVGQTGAGPDAILSMLNSEPALDRRVATIAAARLFAVNELPLRTAVDSNDPEIRKVARDVLILRELEIARPRASDERTLRKD